MSRHRPLNGADSEYVLRPFRCLVEDYDGGRIKVQVNALGRNDAGNLARERARDLGFDVVAVLTVEEVAA